MGPLADFLGFGKKKIEMPKIKAEQAKQTAMPVEQLSEQARKNRRLAASMLTRDWSRPKLGYGGMLGV